MTGPRDAETDARETGRVEAFSDGVFAIAITLLILDVRVPRHDALTTDLVRNLLHLWPSLVAYLLSFTVILVMWVNHHRIFTVVRRTDQSFLFWNGLLLMFVTFVPFPTALLAEYMGYGSFDEFRIAAVVYAGHGFLIALAFIGLWRHAVRRGRLLTRGHMEAEVAFLSPWASVGLCMARAAYFSVQGFAGRG